jgi:hypothetical protein
MFIKIADFAKKRRWYESVIRQGDVQAVVIFSKDPYELGYMLEGRYGKITTHGRMGQHQIEQGQLLLDLLGQQVRVALSEAEWRIVRHSPEGEEIWMPAEHIDEKGTPLPPKNMPQPD